MNKRCPLLIIAYGGKPASMRPDPLGITECMREECAWWYSRQESINSVVEGCAIIVSTLGVR